jgi:group I intron endonuclease
MSTHFIYKITHKESEKSYIGQTNDINRRWKEHTKVKNLTSLNNNNKAYSSYICNAILKYGVEAFDFEVVCECDIESVNDLEVENIAKYNTLSPFGYNLLNGGFANGHHQETRDKMSKSHTGKIVTEITKQRMSKSRMGDLNPNFGKLSCNAISYAKYRLNGDFVAQYPSLKIAARSISAKATPSWIAQSVRKKVSAFNFLWKEAEKNEIFPQKIPVVLDPPKVLNTRSIKGTSPSKEIIHFSSIKEAAKYIGGHTPNILGCLSGRYRITKGWTNWEYTSEKETYNFIATKDNIDIICDGYKDAFAKTGATSGNIKQCIDGFQETAKGFTWKRIK